VAQRAWPAVDEIAARHQPGPVLIVAHGLVLATLLCGATNTPLSQTYQNIPDNAAVTIVHWPTHSARLLAQLAPVPNLAHT
jgi:alpha-ribazole phosphatase/probable phosphoglycerate mutase